jgi:hypothetical protein
MFFNSKLKTQNSKLDNPVTQVTQVTQVTMF